MSNGNSLYEDLAGKYFYAFKMGDWDNLTSFKDHYFEMRDLSDAETDARADNLKLKDDERENVSYYIRAASLKGFGTYEHEIMHMVSELKFWFKLK